MFQFFVVQVMEEVLIYAFFSQIFEVREETLAIWIILFHANFEHSLDWILVCNIYMLAAQSSRSRQISIEPQLIFMMHCAIDNESKEQVIAKTIKTELAHFKASHAHTTVESV